MVLVVVVIVMVVVVVIEIVVVEYFLAWYWWHWWWIKLGLVMIKIGKFDILKSMFFLGWDELIHHG